MTAAPRDKSQNRAVGRRRQGQAQGDRGLPQVAVTETRLPSNGFASWTGSWPPPGQGQEQGQQKHLGEEQVPAPRAVPTLVPAPRTRTRTRTSTSASEQHSGKGKLLALVTVGASGSGASTSTSTRTGASTKAKGHGQAPRQEQAQAQGQGGPPVRVPCGGGPEAVSWFGTVMDSGTRSD